MGTCMCRGGWQRQWCGAVQGSLLACSSLSLQPVLAACPCSLSLQLLHFLLAVEPLRPAPHHAAACPARPPPSSLPCCPSHLLDRLCHVRHLAPPLGHLLQPDLQVGLAGVGIGVLCRQEAVQGRQGAGGQSGRQSCVSVCVCEVGALARPGRQAGTHAAGAYRQVATGTASSPPPSCPKAGSG